MDNLQDLIENEMTYSVYVRKRIGKDSKIYWVCDTTAPLTLIIEEETSGWYYQKYGGHLYCVADRHGVVRFYDKKHRMWFAFHQVD